MPGKSKRQKAAEQRKIKKRHYTNFDTSTTPDYAFSGELLQEVRANSNCKVTSGTFHQGDTRFQYPGIQCTYISFWALICMKNKDPVSWQASDIDLCLQEGNDKFLEHCIELRTEPNMLLVKDLPRCIKTKKSVFDCIQSDDDIITGTLDQQIYVETIGFSSVSIAEAICRGFDRSNSCLLVCGGQTIAIAKNDNHFFIFDPHSRGKDGFLHPTGSAVLVSFSRLQCLISFIESLFSCSLLLRPSELFELVPIIISKRKDKKQTKGPSFLNVNHDTDFETHVERMCSACPVVHQAKQHLLNDQKQHITARHEKAIQSYFADQEKRDKEHRVNRQCLNLCETRNRRQYIRKYMQKRRENESFRKQENKSAQIRMKKIIKTDIGRLKNKERAAEAMRKIRCTEQGKLKNQKQAAEGMKKIRVTEHRRFKNQKRVAEGMRTILSSEEGRKKHNERSCERIKKILNTEKGRQKHNERSEKGMKKMLSTEKGRQKHNEKSKTGMKKMLSTEKGKQKHNEKSKTGMKKMLSTEKGRKKHNER